MISPQIHWPSGDKRIEEHQGNTCALLCGEVFRDGAGEPLVLGAEKEANKYLRVHISSLSL